MDPISSRLNTAALTAGAAWSSWLALACLAPSPAWALGDHGEDAPAPEASSSEEPAACPESESSSCAEERAFGGEHKVHTENLVGAKGLVIATIGLPEASEGEGEAESASFSVIPHFGASLFYERELVAEWLEIELNVAVLSAPGGVLIPIDLLLKKPFHIGRHVTPYVGLGPALELGIREETEVAGGVTAAAGVYVWFTQYLGLDVELDYTLIFESEGSVHGVGGGLGPVVHF